jgi:hypothetical protein
VAQQTSLRSRRENGSSFCLGEKFCLFVHDLQKERGCNSARSGVRPWGPRATRAKSAMAWVLQEPVFEWKCGKRLSLGEEAT